MSIRRLYSSSVVWSLLFNGFRVASGLIILPLLLRKLPNADLGMYYLFLSLTALGPLMDFGFLHSITRSVGYAMGGADKLKPQGLQASTLAKEPNYKLLRLLVHSTRYLYQFLVLGLFVLLSVFGSIIVGYRIQETVSPQWTWIAWVATLLAGCLELYSGWWNTFLRGMDQVLQSTRILVFIYLAKVLITCGLLIAGFGLLSVPAASLVASFLLRFFSRRAVLALLKPHQSTHPTKQEILGLFKVLWPNSWRLGAQFLSGYLATSASNFLCMKYLGLQATAQYGLSLQLTGFISGIAMVWLSVKWPKISQYRAKEAFASVRLLLWERLWLQTVTFVLLAVISIQLIEPALKLLQTDKKVLPLPWLVILLVNSFLETHCCAWTTLIATENRFPFLRPFVSAYIGTLCVTVMLFAFWDVGFGAVVIPPLVIGCSFNYWFWPREGARSIGVNWFQFIASKPAKHSFAKSQETVR